MTRTILPVLVILLPVSALALDLDTDMFRDKRLGIQFAVPTGWQLSRHTGFAPILALMTPVADAKIQLSVASAQLRPGDNIRQWIEENAAALRAIGMKVRAARKIARENQLRPMWRATASWLADEATVPTLTHQIYIQRGRQVFIFTLSAPKPAISQHLSTLTYLVDFLQWQASDHR